MTDQLVSKRDLVRIAYAFPRYHLGRIIHEISEIFEEGDYTLDEMLELKGNIVYAVSRAVYLTKEEYESWSPTYRAKYANLPVVNGKYEWFPKREHRYEKIIIPLYYCALTCKGIENNKIVLMVSEKIFQDKGYFGSSTDGVNKLHSWDKSTEDEKRSAKYLLNYYTRIKNTSS